MFKNNRKDKNNTIAYNYFFCYNEKYIIYQKRISKKKENIMLQITGRKLTTTQIIAFGFLAGIVIGTFLLSLPISAANGKATPLIDALFTATSSICVTGLATLTTATHWSVFGKIVLLVLIQFGGLGIITFTTTILIVLRRRITLKERLLIQDAYNLDTLRGLVRLTIRILKGTLIIEGIGAFFYAIRFIPDFGFIRGIGIAIFNSVSAFCNAGMDIIGDSSLAPYRGSYIVNITTMLLIIIGGIGFPVWWDVLRTIKLQLKRKTLKIKEIFIKLELHSKIVISITLLLIILGAAVIFMIEFSNPATLGILPFHQKVLASFFQSVTTRTAGFLTIPQEGLTKESAFFCIVLMFIGGSPSGTAGGVKTITIGVMILAVISIVKGKEDVEIFHRKISDSYVKKSMAVVMMSLGILIISTMLLSVVENGEFLNIFYETASALATVGLSRDFTTTLSVIGKLIIIVTMYIGRIGPITMALFFNTKKGKNNVRRYPTEKIRIG